MDKDIGSFEVAMNNPKLIKLLESSRDLSDDVERHLFVDFTSHAVPFEISSWAVLHDEIDVILGVDDLIKLDDVGML